MSLLLFASLLAQTDFQALRVGMGGDCYLGGSMAPLLAKEGPGAPCEGLQSVLQRLDLLVLNLESPVSRGGSPEPDKTFTFRMRPEDLAGLQACGAKALNLANNHSMDYGAEALRDTLLNLDSRMLGHFGAGLSLAEARQPWRVEKAGVRLAFLGYSRTLPRNFWAGPDKPGCAPAYEDLITQDIQEARKTADHVFVSFHWGEERNPEPRPYQRDLARLCVDQGAALVFGHHPHVAQPLEIYKGRPILYSLGNFAFASFSYNSEVGLLAEAWADKTAILRLRIYPIDVFTPRTGFRMKLLPLEAALEKLEGLFPPDGEAHRTVLNIPEGCFEVLLSPQNREQGP